MTDSKKVDLVALPGIELEPFSREPPRRNPEKRSDEGPLAADNLQDAIGSATGNRTRV